MQKNAVKLETNLIHRCCPDSEMIPPEEIHQTMSTWCLQVHVILHMRQEGAVFPAPAAGCPAPAPITHWDLRAPRGAGLHQNLL